MKPTESELDAKLIDAAHMLDELKDAPPGPEASDMEKQDAATAIATLLVQHPMYKSVPAEVLAEALRAIAGAKLETMNPDEVVALATGKMGTRPVMRIKDAIAMAMNDEAEDEKEEQGMPASALPMPMRAKLMKGGN